MNPKKIRDLLNKGPIKDYSYAIIFLVVSSFFIIFVIRPVLTIAIRLRNEAQELQQVNDVYEENITRVLSLQSELESVRSRRTLLKEALPEQAMVKALIDDVQAAANEQGIDLEKILIGGVSLKESAEEGAPDPVLEGLSTRTVGIQVTIAGSYDQTQGFMDSLLNQRRIKSIDSFSVKNIEYLTESTVTGLQLDIQIESYYL